PEQLTRKLFPLDASGMNWRTPSVSGWPSRVTVPAVGIRLTPPHPATPTKAASRAQPTPTRVLENPRSMCVTSQIELEKWRGRAHVGPPARPGKGLPIAAQPGALVRDAGVPPGGAGDAGRHGPDTPVPEHGDHHRGVRGGRDVRLAETRARVGVKRDRAALPEVHPLGWHAKLVLPGHVASPAGVVG